MSYLNLPLHIRSQLVTLHSEPHRHYHNIKHVYQCLAELEEWNATENKSFLYLQSSELLKLEVAIWFHDAIYNPFSKMNVEESMRLFMNTSYDLRLGFDYTTNAEICKLILCTEKHERTPGSYNFLMQDLMCDIDLSILGKDPVHYREYQTGISLEYSHIPIRTYSEKRTKVLESFLQRDKIYKTDRFFNLYEEQARINLQNEINELNIVRIT